MRTLSGLLAISWLPLALGSCAHVDPAKVCSDPATTAQVLAIVEDNAVKLVSADDRDAIKQALDRIGIANLLKINLITLASYDKTTNLITCEGQLHAASPAADADTLQARLEAISTPDSDLNDLGKLAKAGMPQSYVTPAELSELGFNNGQADINIRFTRQPQADGKDYVYGLLNPQPVMDLVAFIGSVDAEAAADRAAKAAPAAADQSGSDLSAADAAQADANEAMTAANAAEAASGNPSASDQRSDR